MWKETPKNIILGTLLMATAACGWSDRSAYRQEVFSTDGAAIAGIHQTWEGQCKTIWACMSETKRNYQFQVWAEPKPNVQRTDALRPQLNSERFDGEAISSSYVRNANHHYLLVTSAESQDESDGLEKTFVIRQLQVGSEGRAITSSREIFRGVRNEGVTCDGVGTYYFGVAAKALPSRDGSTIAILDQNNQCGSSSLTLKLIDAETLSVLREEVITPDLDAPDVPPTWTSGWIEVASDLDLSASGEAVVSAIQTEAEFFNASRGATNYQALQSAYNSQIADLAQDDSPQQVFVLLDRGAFRGEVRSVRGFYRAGTQAPSVLIEGLTLNPVEVGQLRVQLRQENATDGFYFESLEAFNQSFREPKATHVRFRRHIELSQQEGSEFEIENELSEYARITKTRWGIERLEEAKQARKLGLYGATYWILNLDNANRTARGKLFCDAVITAFDVEGLEDGVQTTQGCFANEQDEFNPSDGYYEDAERRAIQWAQLHWTFDSEGDLRICEVRASSEAQLDAATIDRSDLEAGCEGNAWLTLRERTYDTPGF